ncbi:MAG: alanine racemase, partial [Alphaproteobacteria bacterium]|nr:alanine racemase [Alphaproteobacteria bacterium]
MGHDLSQLDKHPTEALIHLDRLTHNVRLIEQLVGSRPLWPAIKANAYGHGAEIVARHLTALGHETLCVAHPQEALSLGRADVKATFVILSAMLPEQAGAIVAAGCEPVVCTAAMAAALSAEAERQDKLIAVHVKVDTGMGRIGIAPAEVGQFLDYCRSLPHLEVRGLMSHFARADEADKACSKRQFESFLGVAAEAKNDGEYCLHMANSAAIFDLPSSHLDAVRPGIALYGLAPSVNIVNRRVRNLLPVLEWRSKVTFLKEVPAGTGISYGHSFITPRPSLIATMPIGYGDGLHRSLSDRCAFLIRGKRCPQVGRITMDQSMIDVTALRGQIEIGDDVVIIGRQGDQEVTADELASTLGTINYEVVTAIASRVPRRAVGGDARPAVQED